MSVRPRSPWSRPWPPTAGPLPSRLPGRPSEPPRWWRSADASAWPRFVADLEAALDEVFGPAVVDTRGGWATVSAGGGDVRLALPPLADACAGELPDRWSTVLRDELSSVATAPAAVAAVAIDDLERLRPALRARLVAPAARSGAATGGAPSVPATPFVHDVADGLGAVLVVDTPSVRWTVARSTVAGWGVDPSRLVADVAARTVRSVWQPSPVVPRSGATVLTAPSPFVSAALLAPAVLLGTDGDWVAAAPTCHTVVVGPDRPAGGLEALAARVAALHATGPGPLTPQLYRWSSERGLRAVRP